MDSSQDNSFGSFGSNFAQQGAISSGGDMVLASNGKKKRWPIVVLIILVLAIAGVGVVAVVLKPSDNSNSGQVSDNSYKEKFNIYANYLLYGKKENSNIENFEASNLFAVDFASDDNEYMKELVRLYKDFYEAELAAGADLLPEIPFSEVEELMDFIVAYNELDMIDMNTLREKYLAGGENVAEAYVMNFNINSENDMAITIGNYEKKLAMYKIEFWETGEMPEGYKRIENYLMFIVPRSLETIKSQCGEINRLIRSEE